MQEPDLDFAGPLQGFKPSRAKTSRKYSTSDLPVDYSLSLANKQKARFVSPSLFPVARRPVHTGEHPTDPLNLIGPYQLTASVFLQQENGRYARLTGYKVSPVFKKNGKTRFILMTARHGFQTDPKVTNYVSFENVVREVDLDVGNSFRAHILNDHIAMQQNLCTLKVEKNHSGEKWHHSEEFIVLNVMVSNEYKPPATGDLAASFFCPAMLGGNHNRIFAVGTHMEDKSDLSTYLANCNPYYADLLSGKGKFTVGTIKQLGELFGGLHVQLSRYAPGGVKYSWTCDINGEVTDIKLLLTADGGKSLSGGPVTRDNTKLEYDSCTIYPVFSHIVGEESDVVVTVPATCPWLQPVWQYIAQFWPQEVNVANDEGWWRT